MLDSRMIAATGCMPKVIGSSSDTPLGAPSPGSTPTRIPSRTPPIISAMCGTETAIEKPCSSRSKFSIAPCLQVQHCAEQAMRQRDLEAPLEHDVKRDRRRDGDQHRAQQRQPAQQAKAREQVP